MSISKRELGKELDKSLAKNEANKKKERLRSVKKLRFVHTTNSKGSNKPVEISTTPLFAPLFGIGKLRWILIGSGLLACVIGAITGLFSTMPGEDLSFLQGIGALLYLGGFIIWIVCFILRRRAQNKEYSLRLYEMSEEIKALEMKGYGISTEKQHEFIDHYFGIDMPTVLNISSNS